MPIRRSSGRSEINIGVDAQGRYVDRKPAFMFTSVDALADDAAAHGRRREGTRRRHQRRCQATHQSVIHVMEAARAAGIIHITFATQAPPNAPRK